jgi:hypothetical protein
MASSRETAVPRALGTRPPQPKGSASAGPLELEHLSEHEGWAVIENGRQINPFIRTAAALAFYLSREKLTDRITNLELLPANLQEVAKRAYKK